MSNAWDINFKEQLFLILADKVTLLRINLQFGQFNRVYQRCHFSYFCWNSYFFIRVSVRDYLNLRHKIDQKLRISYFLSTRERHLWSIAIFVTYWGLLFSNKQQIWWGNKKTGGGVTPFGFLEGWVGVACSLQRQPFPSLVLHHYHSQMVI